MTDTTNLGLPCIEGSQAQKHVTHNDALRILDTLVQLAVLDRDLTAPPGSPSDGQRWIVEAGATGAWAGHDNAVTAWQDGAWRFCAPQTGWLAYVVDEGALLAWNGSAWVDAIATITSLNNMTLLGVGTTADATNPFSAKLNNTLFTAKSAAEGGDGDLRYKMSKEAAANTLSLLFQDGYSGRAEIGLTGDDDFHFKVSPDGSTWHDGIVIDRTSGEVTFPNTTLGGGSGGAQTVPGGRLTLASATPVLTADAVAQQTLYYTPYQTALVPIYDGSAWTARTFTELSVTMAGSANWSAGSLYDWFVIDDGGTLRLASGPAWTSATSRGAGAGTTELQMLDGPWANKNAITARYGPSSTVSVAANRATYVGTMLATADGQTGMAFTPTPAAGGSANILGLWNAYNRVPVRAVSQDSTSFWDYSTTTTWRAANNSTNNRVTWIDGLAQSAAVAQYLIACTMASPGDTTIAVGLDWSAGAGQGQAGFNNTGYAVTTIARLLPMPQLGKHHVTALEYVASGTARYYAVAGDAGGMRTNGLSVDLDM